MQLNTIIHGNNIEVLKTFPDNSVDAIITDSPYGLGKEPDAVKCLQDWIDHGYHEIKGRGFMGKDWDAFVPQPVLWKECFRVLKPGGHLLSFFGTRTYDWGTLAIRLAGFEIRDCIMWVYGSGFPKSLDVSKAIDKAAGAERPIIGKRTDRAALPRPKLSGGNFIGTKERIDISDITAPVTDDGKKWEGYGTALKPAVEPICVARKPLEGTVVENVLKYGTGSINIDEGRVETNEIKETYEYHGHSPSLYNQNASAYNRHNGNGTSNQLGRWPANFIHDGSEDVLAYFPDAPGQAAAVTGNEPTANGFSGAVKFSGKRQRVASSLPRVENDKSAARFFYCAKASPSERDGRKSVTIKPISLMEHLIKIYCPQGGVCLDPHMGSGTTAAACINIGMDWIGIEQDEATVHEANDFLDRHRSRKPKPVIDPQQKLFE